MESMRDRARIDGCPYVIEHVASRFHTIVARDVRLRRETITMKSRVVRKEHPHHCQLSCRAIGSLVAGMSLVREESGRTMTYEAMDHV